jgi:type VI secretion system protein ImpH
MSPPANPLPALPGNAEWLAILRHLENRGEGMPVGEFFSPAQEALILRTSLLLEFPARAVEAIATAGSPDVNQRPCVTTPLSGLTGALAALPYHYTDALVAGAREGNTAPIDFFGIFNHRALSLLYRAQRKHRPVLLRERAMLRNGDDLYTQILLALSGHAPARASTDGTPAAWCAGIIASHAALFLNRVRTADNLQQLLRHCFRLDICIRQFAGRWLAMAPHNTSSIGRTGRNNRLAHTVLLGRRQWNIEYFFDVIVRYPRSSQLAQLAPGQPLRQRLQFLVSTFVGKDYGFDIVIVTNRDVQQPARLACRNIRLGWSGTLGQMTGAQNAVIRIPCAREGTAARSAFMPGA